MSASLLSFSINADLILSEKLIILAEMNPLYMGSNFESQDLPSLRVFVFYHKDMNATSDGQTAYVKKMIEALKTKYSVSVIYPNLSKFNLKGKSRMSVRYFTIMTLSTLFKQFMFIKEIHFFSKFFKNKGIFIVEDVYASFLPVVISKLFGIKIVYWASDARSSYLDSMDNLRKVVRIFYSLYRNLLESISVRNSSMIIVPSVEMIQEIKSTNKYTKRFLYLPYHAIPSKPEKTRGEAVKRTLGLGNKIVVAFIGDLYYGPNLEAAEFIIYDLAPRMAISHPNLLFLLIGPGNDLLNLETTYSNVLCVGKVDSIGDYLSVSNIGINPSTVIGGTSIKIIDYLSYGLVVLSTPEAARGVIGNRNLKVKPRGQFEDGLEACIEMLNGKEEERNVDYLVRTHYLSNIWYENLVRQLGELYGR